MLSVKAADKIYQRLLSLCGGSVTVESISSLSDEDIKTIGTSKQKLRYIRSLTEAVSSGALDFSILPQLCDSDVMKKLTAIQGIGNWTAKMYLIFVLNRQDVLPVEDGAFLQAYRWLYETNDTSRAAIEDRCDAWKPYSSIAARYLYRALDGGHTKSDVRQVVTSNGIEGG